MKLKFLVLTLLAILMIGVASVALADAPAPVEDPCIENPLLPQCADGDIDPDLRAKTKD